MHDSATSTSRVHSFRPSLRSPWSCALLAILFPPLSFVFVRSIFLAIFPVINIMTICIISSPLSFLPALDDVVSLSTHPQAYLRAWRWNSCGSGATQIPVIPHFWQLYHAISVYISPHFSAPCSLVFRFIRLLTLRFKGFRRPLIVYKCSTVIFPFVFFFNFCMPGYRPKISTCRP